jgi:hypothetical protein
MTEELVIYVDYVGESKYGVFVGEINDDMPDVKTNSVDSAVNWIIENYGIDAHVEFSHGADLIFKIDNGIPFDRDLS